MAISAVAARHEQQRGRPLAYWVAGVVCVVSLAVFAAMLFSTQRPVLFGDYAEWTYHGMLLRDVFAGQPDPAYVLKHYPVPNSLTTVGLGLLMLWLPWQAAAKVWLLLEVGTGLVAGAFLFRTAKVEGGWQLLLLPATALMGGAFWFGFTNFLWGTYFAMAFCGLLLAGAKSRWMLGLVLLLAFFSHMVPFGFAVLLLLLYVWQSSRRELLWTAAPSAVLCVWYFAGRWMHADADGKAGMVASVRYLSPAFVAFKANTFLKCWGFVNPASTSTDSVLLRVVGLKLFLLLFVLNAVIAVAMLVLFYRATRHAVRERMEQWFIWLAVAIFVGVALLMPGAAAGISDPGGRMMQTALWCGACVVATKSRWLGIVVGASATVLLAADLALVPPVALRSPMAGSDATSIPGAVRQFGHVYYADRTYDYDSLDTHRMDQAIYPTAMFLKR